MITLFQIFYVVVFVAALGFTNCLSQAQDVAPSGTQATPTEPSSPAARGREAPEQSTGKAAKELAIASKHMVVAANPYASRAGLEILRAGGSAVDAAIASQLVLNLVEPQSSGIGGGGFLLHWDDKDKSLTSYDGRETAPAAAKPDRFLIDGQPMPFRKAVKSGLSIGVPGLLRMFELAHKKHGKLPWAVLFEPAIRLAEEGFEISPRLNGLLYFSGGKHFDVEAKSYFFGTFGLPLPIGSTLKNPQFAATLKLIAKEGAGAFYEGPLAEKIVAAVKNAHSTPGDMTLTDLSSYQARQIPPVCVLYRGKKICGMGPPSSGGITVLQALKLIEEAEKHTGLSVKRFDDAVHMVAEAEKLAFADRNKYIADENFVPVPSGLLDEAYLMSRAQTILKDRVTVKAKPGLPPGLSQKGFGIDATIERPGTTHVSIVDRDGNAVSLTSSIEGAFGSGVWVAGFLLNNELTDFSFRPTDKNGTPIANRVEGGKRPRSSMAPTVYFDAKSNDLEGVLGSPGGSRIILYVIKALVTMIDWDLDPQEAAAYPNFGARREKFELESSIERDERYLKPLGRLGYKVRRDRMTSGLHIIQLKDGKLYGGADPRREGVALGE